MTAKHTASDKRKQSLYFPGVLLSAIQTEATRLDRSLSWCVQRCVKRGLAELQSLPAQELAEE